MRFLIVAIAVFVCAAGIATLAAIPVLEWASGGSDWKIAVAIAWFIVCYLIAAWAAMRFMDAIRN